MYILRSSQEKNLLELTRSDVLRLHLWFVCPMLLVLYQQDKEFFEGEVQKTNDQQIAELTSPN